MKNRRLMIIFLVAILASLLLLNNNCMAEKYNPEGQTYYTRINLWNSEYINTWCSHKGYILPLGTRVTITRLTSSSVKFHIEDGQNMLMRRSRHTSTKMPKLFDLYFAKGNPKAVGGGYDGLSEFDKKYVDIGTIVPGMSKEAAVMAYGYPPDKTGSVSLTTQKWIYWGPTRFEARITLYFFNNVVYKVDRLVQRRGGPFGIGRSSRIETDVLSEEDPEIINKPEEISHTSLATEIGKISELHKSGQLTDEEFRKAKEKLLD